MRHVVTPLAAFLLAALLLAGCGPTPKPFEHEAADDIAFHPKRDKNEVIVATPANMPGKLAEKLASALALELQSYDIVAAVQPAQAPLKVAGATSTRDAGFGLGIEIQIEWYLLGNGAIQGPAISKTVARTDDPAAQPASATRPKGPTIKVMVSQVVGAPSDGNRQLFSGMRRALGSSRIVVIDKAGADTFIVGATVKLTPIDDQKVQLDISWVLTDPTGKEVGKVDQSNPVPIAATKGSWVGFGDIVAAAAVEGVLELLDKALNKQPR